MSKLRNINAKINRKKLVHAKRRDIQEMKFEGVEGPLDTVSKPADFDAFASGCKTFPRDSVRKRSSS